MSGKKEKNVEFRYYKVPEGDLVLPLFGDNWRGIYGQKKEPLHFHNLLEIGICVDGKGEMTFTDGKVDYSENTLTIIPRHFPHHTKGQEGTTNYWEYLFFDPEVILQSIYPGDKVFTKSLLNKVNKSANCYHDAQDMEIFKLVRSILDECRNKKEYSNEVIRGLLLALVIVIARENESEGEFHEKTGYSNLEHITVALDYIHNNFKDDISVKMLASECGLSETHFRRVFKDSVGMSPIEYITLVRIENANELIRTTRYSMSEVAYRVGYPTVSTFNRNFKKILGISPFQYRKNIKSYKGVLLDYNVTAKKGWTNIQNKD